MRKDAQEKNKGPLTSKIRHSEACDKAARDEGGCGVGNILKLQGLSRAGLTYPSSINMGVPNGSRSSADTSW